MSQIKKKVGQDLKAHIGNETRHARIAAKMSQKELAEKVGYSHTTSIYAIEKGKEWVSLKTLV